MTAYERDTSIVYNDAEDIAILCTFSPLVMRRMAKLCSKTSSIVVRKQTDDYAELFSLRRWLRSSFLDSIAKKNVNL